MKANELRIGNLVGDQWTEQLKNYKYIKVESINDKGINLTITDDGNWSELAQHFITPEYEFSQLRGIPLSEEILLKCGFEKDEDGWLHISYDQEDHRESYGIKWNGEYWEYYMFDLTKINYVHQLQNLIFSLTCQELNTSGL